MKNPFKINKVFFWSICVAVANSLDFRERLSVIASHGSLINFFTSVDRPKKNLAITLIATFFFFEKFRYHQNHFSYQPNNLTSVSYFGIKRGYHAFLRGIKVLEVSKKENLVIRWLWFCHENSCKCVQNCYCC